MQGVGIGVDAATPFDFALVALHADHDLVADHGREAFEGGAEWAEAEWSLFVGSYRLLSSSRGAIDF